MGLLSSCTGLHEYYHELSFRFLVPDICPSKLRIQPFLSSYSFLSHLYPLPGYIEGVFRTLPSFPAFRAWLLASQAIPDSSDQAFHFYTHGRYRYPRSPRPPYSSSFALHHITFLHVTLPMLVRLFISILFASWFGLPL